MPPETPRDELASLTRDIKEHLTFLHELGVEHVESVAPVTSVPARSGVTPPQATGAAPAFKATAVAASPAPDLPRQRRGPAPGITGDTLFGDLSTPPPTLPKSSETFEDIWADIGDCTRCPLYQGRTNIVHTEGNRKARLMFVGEAPGADEDAQARPFVGRAGQLLTKIIEAIGLKREEVLIGNVNRCRPPANRPPTQEEASMCKPFLVREIAAAQPGVIVVLGNTAMKNLLDTKIGITRLRGEFQDYHGVKVMPTFHPAYLLRDPSKKKETWEDLKKVRDYLETTARRT
ncbi:MAG TPA: uracil-DNA glycosylase [Pyrinomonadaceae bacterium]|nr:uracil-DNA glycosylase [Pyrinomonadaceae bacterium]